MQEVLSTNDLDRLALETDARQGEVMLNAVHKFLARFVSYPNAHGLVAHVLWCVHAHLMQVWDSTPRIAFLSPEPASGKTRALEATELIVPNPVSAVNVSPAYLFRKVGNEEGATILFDEIDTVFGPKAKENEEIRGLLNAGHRRGAVAGRLRCRISLHRGAGGLLALACRAVFPSSRPRAIPQYQLAPAVRPWMTFRRQCQRPPLNLTTAARQGSARHP